MRRMLTAVKRKVAALLPRRLVLAPVPARRGAGRRGLTLVEMLVTVAITLIIMAAVVNIFAAVGKGVQDRRATIEIANQLRIARTLLAQDLARATASTLPPRDPSSGEGYFEYIEGIQTDWFPTRLTDERLDVTTGDLELDPGGDLRTWIAPKGKSASRGEDEPTLDNPLAAQYADYRRLGLSGLGDFDDVLAFTVRSQGEPFIGRFGDTTIKSYEAEVIWFAIENQPNPPISPNDARIVGEPGMRTLYRRVLLVAPWVEPQLASLGPADTASAEGLRNFYRNYDVSARIDLETGNWVPNSLSDLTKREYRFAHAPNFPHGIDLERIRFIQVAAGNESRTPLAPLDLPGTGTVATVDRRGEDVVLTNVLAFDVRAYDPLAPLLLVKNTVVEPSDIGWHVPRNGRWEPAFIPNATNPTNIVGRGAYVDLAYMGDPTQGVYEPFDVPIGAARSVFSMAPHIRSGFVQSGGMLVRGYYDTWSTHYEYDGVNQDSEQLMPGLPDTDILIDEGTNGVDDDGTGGVDDPGERETCPPYLSPLRGLEVKLRIYEPDSRAVREVSVKHNFTPQ